MKNLIVTDPAILKSLTEGAAAPAPAAGSPKPSSSVEGFVSEYLPLAQRVGEKLGVEPHLLLGQWGLETGWGKSVIPGTNNLGNIKDPSGRGAMATDNMTGSRDAYRKYGSADEFGEDFAGMLGRLNRYRGALGAGGDANAYFAELKRGGYAEDPDYVSKGTRAADMARAAMGGAAPAARGGDSDLPTDFYMPDRMPTPAKDRGLMDGAADLGRSMVQGVKMLGRNILASGNAALGNLSDVELVAESQRAAAENDPQAKKALMAEIQRRQAEDPNPTLMSALKNVGGAAAGNLEGTAQLVVEQAPNAAMVLGSGAAGGKMGAALGAPLGPLGALVGGGAGFLFGMFMGNALIETGAKAIEKSEDGFTPQDRQDVFVEGAKKAGVMTAIDGLTFKLGTMIPRTLSKGAVTAGARAEAKVLADAGVDIADGGAIVAALKADPALRKAAANAGQEAAAAAVTTGQKAGAVGTNLVLETVGEGAGEGLGEYAATGEYDPYNIALESLMGLAQSGPQAIMSAGTTPSNNLGVKGILQAQADSGGALSKAVLKATEGNDAALGEQPMGQDIEQPAYMRAGADRDAFAPRELNGMERAGRQWQAMAEQDGPGLEAQRAEENLQNAGQRWQEIAPVEPAEALRQQRVASEAAQPWLKMQEGMAPGEGVASEPAAPVTPADLPEASPQQIAAQESALPWLQMQDEVAANAGPTSSLADSPVRQVESMARDAQQAPRAQRASPESGATSRLADSPRRRLDASGLAQAVGLKGASREGDLYRAAVRSGFDTIEAREDGSWLLNLNTGEGHRLPNSASLLRARKAVGDYVRENADAAAPSPRNARPEPTDAQKKAGNYAKGHLRLNGFDIAIENPRDSVRSGTAPDGKRWESRMAHDYGYIKRTTGADKDQVDVFIGPRPDTKTIFVVDQVDPETGLFDESKALFGFRSEYEAREGYLANYEPGWQGLGSMVEMTPEQFGAWVKSGNAKLPASDFVAGAPKVKRPNRVRVNTQAEAAAVSTLSQALGQPVAVADPRDEQAQALGALLDAWANLTGKRGIAVTTAADPGADASVRASGGFDGLQFGEDFFVNVDRPQMHVAQTIAHEFKHMTERSPAMAKLYERIWSMISEQGRREYYEGYLAPNTTGMEPSYDKATPADLERLRSEMTADFFGQRFNDRAWLQQLAKQKPALFGDFVRDWLRVLNSLIGRLKALAGQPDLPIQQKKNVDQYIAQLEEAKAIAAEVATEWAQRNAGLAQKAGIDSNGVVMSARDESAEFPDIDEEFFDDEMQAMLQEELEAEMAGGIDMDDGGDTFSPSALKRAGLMAEDLMDELPIRMNEDGFSGEIHVPDFHREGKKAIFLVESPAKADGLWAVSMGVTWVGPAMDGTEGFATLPGIKNYVRRLAAGRQLGREGFDLATVVTKQQAKDLTDNWRSLSEIEKAFRYRRPPAGAKSIPEIAAGLGITEHHEIKVSMNEIDMGATAYDVVFKDRKSGVSHEAKIEVQTIEGRKHMTAGTIGLGGSGLGGAFYQMAAEMAVRRGMKLSPESQVSGINSYRRTEQMISAALRTGKSTAMVPHYIQRIHGFNADAKTAEQHNENLVRMLLAAVRNVREIAPELADVVYHVDTAAFTMPDGSSADALVTEVLGRTDARAFGLGRAQLARASITRQILDGKLKAADVKSISQPILYSARDRAGQEYQAVVDEHRGKPTWLKAPNGIPTKLSERQWVQVRTPSFKAWFGDWEAYAGQPGGVWSDDGNQVSKAVNPETGEPLVLYHGTNNGGFVAFRETGGEQRGDLGIFTTSNYNMARTYVSRGRLQDFKPPADRAELEDAGYQFEEQDDGRIRLFDVDGYEVDTFADEASAVAEALRTFEGASGVPTVYAVFANMRGTSEEDFQGAAWNGSFLGTDKWEVYDANGETAYLPSGEGIMDRAQAEALAMELGGIMEPASDLPFTSDSVARDARANGMDGAILRQVVDDGGGAGSYFGEPSDVFVIFDPSNVKSAEWNTGDFGADTHDMRFSLREPNFDNPEDRLEVSTAYPTAKPNKKTGYQPNAYDEYRVIDSKDITESKKHLSQIVSALREYNTIRPSENADELLADLHDTVVENLLWLHDKVDPGARERAKRWYDGANRIARDWSRLHGLLPRQTSGILAVLSPQMDWFKNVSLAERAILIMRRHGAEPWSPGMTAWSESWLAASKTVEERDSRAPLVERMRAIAASKQPLGSLSTEDAALYIRAFDEAYFPREYRLVTPEGGFGDFVANNGGALSSITWGGFGTIEKAASIYRDGSFANISEALGGEHKVRNFYNNIISPGSRDGHVTIDTHAVAAAFIKPLAGSDTEVLHNLGGLGSTADTGASGSYALYADAYRDAAARRGILAREMQSITWEAVRALFPAEEKKGLKERVNAIWDRYRAGEISRAEAREEVLEISGGINSFAWEGGGDGEFAADGAHSFNQALPDEPTLREARTLAPGRVRDEVRVSLSSATNSIPGIRSLYEAANKGDAMAGKLLQDIAFDSLQYLLRGTSAKVQADFVTGLYGGAVEPSLGLSIKFDDADRQQVLAAIARFADNFNQEQVHVRRGSKDKLGATFDDGSYVTPVYTWRLDRALNRKEVQSIIDKSGLYGLTFGDGFVEAYYVGDPKDEKSLEQFSESAKRAGVALGAHGSRVESSLARLWPYGDGDGTIGFDRIRGDVPGADAEFSKTARRVAEYLNAKAGIDGKIKVFDQAAEVSPKQAALQREIAQIYEALPDNDLKNPRVRKAYTELGKEVLRQFSALPVKVEVLTGNGEPYANSAAMRRDILNNNHLFIFGTTPETFGPPGEDFSGHPLLADSGLKDAAGQPLVLNDLLRAVHDYYAHGMSPTQFGPKGEEAAWKNHMAATANPWARWALTMETRGQNSWVNFREDLDPATPVKDRPFARQKAALIPVQYTLTGDKKVDAPMKAFIESLPEKVRHGSKPVKKALPKGVKLSARTPGELFFSELSRQIEKASMKQAQPAAWKTFIKALSSKGVKADEVEWTGVNEWLDLQPGKVTRDELLAYLKGNGVQVAEVVLGAQTERQKLMNEYDRAIAASDAAGGAMNPSYIETLAPADRLPEEQAVLDAWNRVNENPDESYLPDASNPKYGQYTLPGGDNYREVLLTLPASPRKARFDVLSRKDKSILKKANSREEAQAWLDANSGMPAARGAEIVERASGQPAKAEYRSNHWDQPNVLAHIRLNDRTDADGARVLFVEEVQSDWGQEGKKRGFNDPIAGRPARDALKVFEEDVRARFQDWLRNEAAGEIKPSELDRWVAGQLKAYKIGDMARTLGEGDRAVELQRAEMEEESRLDKQLPSAPFVTKTDGWLNLALKRIIAMAVDEGYDKVAFVTGEQSAERYDLSKQVSDIMYRKAGDGAYYIVVGGPRGGIHSGTHSAAELENYVGKEIAQRIVERATDKSQELSGLDLKVGGEGMKTFYNAIVPNATKAMLKKLGGGQLGSVAIPGANAGREVVAAQVPGESMWGVYDRQKGQWLESWDKETYTSDPENAELTSEKTAKNIASAIMRDAGVMLDQPGFEITDAMREKVAGGMPLFSARDPYGTAPKSLMGFRSSGPSKAFGETKYPHVQFVRATRDNGNTIVDAIRGMNSAHAMERARRNWDGATIEALTRAQAEAEEPGIGADVDAAMRMSARIDPQTQTEAFKRWFGDSKVVDGNGRPLVVYHGTRPGNDIQEFAVPNDRDGIYFTPSASYAGSFTSELFDNTGAAGAIYPSYLSIQNPYIVRSDDIESEEAQSFLYRGLDRRDLESQGYDGAMLYLEGELDQIIAFRPEQIKSATGNGGGFDPGSPDIRRSQRDQTGTPAFKKWFGNSKVVTAEGKPLVVYRGEHGEDNGRMQTKLGSFTFSSYEAASAYAAEPNDGSDAVAPRVIPAYLSIQNPIFNDPEDPYVFLSSLIEKLGQDTAMKFVRKHEDRLGEGAFEDDPTLYSLEDVIKNQPEKLGSLYIMAFPLLDDPEFVKAAKAAGYDGAIYGGFGDFDDAEYRVFGESQIKSAIGNSGAFDGANPDIRFSAWDAPAPSRFDDFVYKTQDKLIDLKRVTQSIKKAMGGLADDLDAYLQEELFHGRAAKRTHDFGVQELQPLMEQIAANGLTIADVEEYLHARHAKEANRVIAQRNPGVPAMQDGGSGMTDADADAYMNSLTPEMRRKLDAVAARVDGMISTTRQLYVSYGLESQDTVDGWESMFQHYIPLQREDKDGSGGMSIGQGFSVKGRETKGRTGSKRKVVDILANIAMQRERLIVRGEKNRVALALLGMAAHNPNPDFWQVGPPPAERVYDPKTNTVVERVDPMYRMRDNVVMAKVRRPNGEVQEMGVVFNEDDPRAMRLAGAMKNLDAPNLEGLLGISAKITRYFAAINTQYNPVFGVVNLIRDVQGAMVNLGETPLAGQRARIAKDTFSALVGIYGDLRAERKGGQGSSQWTQLWDEFQSVGGKTGFRELFRTSKDRAEALQKIVNPDGWADNAWGKVFTANGALKVPVSKAKRAAEGLFSWLSDYNEALENGVRLAAYKAGLDQGMSQRQAASVAKNLTVNFNRKGQVGAQAGAVYAFFNAAMQGTARIGQVLFTMDGGDPKTLRLSKTGQKVIYGGVLLGVVQALALAAAGFDEEDPPPFLRERSLVIPIGDKKYLSIPMPLGLHVIPGLGRHMTEFALSGFEKPAHRMAEIMGMLADSFNPIGNAGLSMQTLAPTALDPLVALTENRDWTGKPIARTSMNPATPGHALYKDTASTWSKALSEAVNWVTGGNEYVAGVVSPTPDQIDYLIGQITGGVGREISKLDQSGRALVSGEDLPTFKMPLVGRFIGNAKSQSSEGTAFYANTARLNELETEVKGLRKDGRMAEAQQLLAGRPDAYLIAVANTAERQIQRLRREKRALVESGAPRERVKEVEAKITEAMARLNRAVEKAEAAQRSKS